jgi:hypothetical protein
MVLPLAAARTVIETPSAASDPERPDLFSLANPETVRSILATAGFHDIHIVAHNDEVETPAHQIPAVTAARTRIGPIAESLRTADADTRIRVTRAIRDALRGRLHNGVVRLTRGTLVVTAAA